MSPPLVAALTLMHFCRCCFTRQVVQRKGSWRFGHGKRESPLMVRQAACRGQHSCELPQVGRDHDADRWRMDHR